MVVLSACESGVGKLYRGEGIVSLASGFAYAGAASILTTLWSVNDERSAVFMEQFYDRLKTGNTKDLALQMTKVAMLERGDDYYAHPYYWAGYVAIGDMQPLYSRMQTRNVLLIGLGLMALILAAWAIARSRSGKQNIS
jgi:CHAT domain-containing protein